MATDPLFPLDDNLVGGSGAGSQQLPYLIGNEHIEALRPLKPLHTYTTPDQLRQWIVGDLMIFDIVADAIVEFAIPPSATAVYTLGYLTIGKGPVFWRIYDDGDEPSDLPEGPAKIQLPDDRWMVNSEQADLTPFQFGAYGDGTIVTTIDADGDVVPVLAANAVQVTGHADDAAFIAMGLWIQATGGLSWDWVSGTTYRLAGTAQLWDLNTVPVNGNQGGVTFVVTVNQRVAAQNPLFNATSCPMNVRGSVSMFGNNIKTTVVSGSFVGSILWKCFDACRPCNIGHIYTVGCGASFVGVRNVALSIDSSKPLWVATGSGGAGFSNGDTFEVLAQNNFGGTVTAKFTVLTSSAGAVLTYSCTNEGFYPYGTLGNGWPPVLNYNNPGIATHVLTGGGSGLQILYHVKDASPETKAYDLNLSVYSKYCVYSASSQFFGHSGTVRSHSDFTFRGVFFFGCDLNIISEHKHVYLTGANVSCLSGVPTRGTLNVTRLKTSEEYGANVDIFHVYQSSTGELDLDVTFIADYTGTGGGGVVWSRETYLPTTATDPTYGRKNLLNYRLRLNITAAPSLLTGLVPYDGIVKFNSAIDWSNEDFTDFELDNVYIGPGQTVLLGTSAGSIQVPPEGFRAGQGRIRIGGGVNSQGAICTSNYSAQTSHLTTTTLIDCDPQARFMNAVQPFAQTNPDGSTFTWVVSATGRRIPLFATQVAARTGNNDATAQAVFDASWDTLTVRSLTTYFMEAVYYITRAAGTNVHATSILFAGTATFSSIGYEAVISNPAGNGLAATNRVYATAATAVIIAAADADATEAICVTLSGIFRVNGSGTIIPQFKYDTAPGGVPTILANSFIRLTPIGANTISYQGQWT